ncbi:LIM and calponin homology domains-containing protein 1-like isoform X2 [Eleginops maclovinus]|uniref:LIM and calponin homology domains-containing protein 1-like isoform X2 n=1 Tax=Eleginops maclovinus TaxID=56733 RepID=UPI003080EDD1
MASPTAGRDVPDASPRDEPEPSVQPHPEPACLEAQKWIEAVTGKSFGEKDFRRGLENGILLCELLSAIKPGLVKKINRLPTPIAGLDNLSVFLRGCEELGLKGAQLFDPGDLQDTSIRANLKDSDCNRKLKNVLNTLYWLGKAASGCASYSGPTLNLKEFEGLLAQMRVESDEGGDGSQKRSVRDSGYDCWDSERSDSLSPPQHTRDNSLDSLDSFGSRSQHSPSPDVVNRGNSDGRGSDSDADAPSRRPDVRKDDMLARRTASSESRSFVPFNQFLPNRTNTSCYIPAPRRKPHTEEGDQRRTVSMSDIINEEEVGHLPPLSQSRNERMHEQHNNFQEDDDHWRNDLARWKNRRRSASQDLIKKEEERKRMEKRMKEEGIDSNKRKSIKTYKEILEEKERREAELCQAYRNAATPEEAAMVLQRYALRFTISDATLDSLKLPRSTSNIKQEHNQADKENKLTPTIDETSEPPHKPEPLVMKEQRHTEPEDMETKITQRETSVSVSSSSTSAGSPLSPVTISENVPSQSLKLNEPRSKPTESPTTQQKPPTSEETKPQTNHARPQIVQVQPHTTQPTYTLPSPPPVFPRPVPLLAAKPYCQPRNTQSGHKPVKMDGLVRVNGDLPEGSPCSTPPASALPSPLKVKDVPSEKKEEEVLSKQTEKDAPSEKISTNHEKVEHTASPQREKPTTCLGSAISSLIGGRNSTTTTIIVTELTQSQPHHPDVQSNGQVNTTSGLSSPVEENKSQPTTSSHSMQDYSPTVTEGLEESSVTIETPMLNLAKRVNHWVWDPNEERKRLESWQQEQERLLQEQYQREQEKLKQEWEKAQLEVQEEERKHNEEERKILEETVAPLNPTSLLNQQPLETGATSSAPESNAMEEGSASPQQNGQRREGTDDQHVSKLHFIQDSPCDGEPSKKQELWKTASLDRNPQLNQAQFVKRSESHDAVTSTQQAPPTSPQPPSPSRCVSGRRLCSGCSQPLGKGAAMIIDTLGLFFHVQCFKCAVCEGQLGDATVGTDVRIRNGLLSCHECYIASRGRGQPTTL